MTEIAAGILALLAGAFSLIAGLGLLRMPDVVLRMHASTKAGTLACGLTMLAMALAFQDFGVSVRAAGVVLFLLLTAPVAAHMIARAALRTGVPIRLWDFERGEPTMRPAADLDEVVANDPLPAGRAGDEARASLPPGDEALPGRPAGDEPGPGLLPGDEAAPTPATAPRG